jgi:hypothetical protein
MENLPSRVDKLSLAGAGVKIQAVAPDYDNEHHWVAFEQNLMLNFK